MQISDKEFAVIREISNNHRPNQRIIAQKVGISLGLTNLIIKRLITKGYIKIKEVPPKTIQYMLTPKGFAEKARKSYFYTLRTIETMRTIKENIQEIIIKEYEQGGRDFIIYGKGELASFTEIALRDLNLNDIKYTFSTNKTNMDRPFCSLFVLKNNAKKKIDILSELSARGVYLNI
jgi:DNA-binding MarR family transcriptional regulator